MALIDPTASIHSSAIVEQGAEIGPGCQIGPFCVVGAEAKLAANVELKSHVALAGDTTVGEGTIIWPFASVGHQPQDLKFAGEATRLVIGARNMIRESVSINPGTVGGGGLTQIGDDCLFMLGTHVGHDCKVGNRVIMANHASLAGHVELGDHAILGGLAGIVQFSRIGQGAIVGAGCIVSGDVIPYAATIGARAQLGGLNLTGLKRRGLDKAEIHRMRAAYRALFSTEGTLRERAAQLASDYADMPLVQEITTFLLAEPNRSFILPND
ncbi:MAG: acyl-ACP--UDP-N-acetylglucosamine O-acyltransferase [Paracoccaceae bacterium]